jgi:ADP-heptose:LPS heptosyltransferase
VPDAAPACPLPERPVIVILRALPGLGDWLCAVPTLRALRRARPDAAIHLVGHGPTRHLADRYRRYVDDFHAFPGWPGLPERRPDVRALPAFLASIQALQADLAIQLHGAGDRTNDIVELFGARRVAGFSRPSERCPDPARFLRWHDDDPEVRRGLRLLQLLGLKADDEGLEFPLDPAGEARAATLLDDTGVAGPFVVIHPGAARPVARWRPDAFAAVARSLAATGRRVVVTGDSGEQSLTAAVARAVPGSVDLGGRTDLDSLGWLLRAADLLVSNDTGVAHLASALQVPSVVVFATGGPEHRRRWAPLDTRRHRAVSPSVPQATAEASRLLRALERAA